MPYPREMTPLPAGVDPASAPGWAGKAARIRKALRRRGFFCPRNEREQAEFVLVNALHRSRPIRVMPRRLWKQALAGVWKGGVASVILALAALLLHHPAFGARLLTIGVLFSAAGATALLLPRADHPSPEDPGWSKERIYAAVATSGSPPKRWPEQRAEALLSWPHLVLRELLLTIWTAATAIALAMLV